MMFFLSSLLYLSAAQAQDWHLVQSTTSATLVGVGASPSTVGAHAGRMSAKESIAVAAASDNNVGGEMTYYDGLKWTKQPVNVGLTLDAAIASTGKSVCVSLWDVVTSEDSEQMKKETDIHGTSQSASIIGGTDFALVGGFIAVNTTEFKNGVAVSSNGGETWAAYDIESDFIARYGSFPSDKVWYVSAGVWGDAPQDMTNKEKRENMMEYPLTGKLSVKTNGTMTFKFDQHRDLFAKKANKEEPTPTGWAGTVSKTSDAGQTWETVWKSDLNHDYYYFNGIACSNEDHCVAVAEGYDMQGEDAIYAITTFDGGANWKVSLQDSQLSMMSAAWINDKEGWLGGSGFSEDNRRTILGLFYYTADGGETWTLTKTLEDCYLIDMDFGDDGVGYAACSSSSGSTSKVAMYD